MGGLNHQHMSGLLVFYPHDFWEAMGKCPYRIGDDRPTGNGIVPFPGEHCKTVGPYPVGRWIFDAQNISHVSTPGPPKKRSRNKIPQQPSTRKLFSPYQANPSHMCNRKDHHLRDFARHLIHHASLCWLLELVRHTLQFSHPGHKGQCQHSGNEQTNQQSHMLQISCPKYIIRKTKWFGGPQTQVTFRSRSAVHC